MRVVRVLADDLTGACDVGGALLGFGRPVRVGSATGEAPASSRDPGALWIENTQSRAVDAAEAVRRVRNAVGARPLAAGEVALKKIDTALRGHVAAELCAAVDALRPGLVLVAPAIPEVGRTTEGGVQLIDGVPVSDTAFGRDPVNPVAESSVVRTLEALGGGVQTVPLDVVRSASRYAALLRDARRGAPAVLVADAVVDSDLECSAVAAARAGEPLLVVGSIGIARALVPVLGEDSPRGERPPEPTIATRGVLVACGSVHPAARAQLAAVDRRWGVAPCRVEAAPEVSGEFVAALLAASGLGVLTLGSAPADPTTLGASIGRAVATAVERHRPSGLVLIGGETAYHCLRALGDPALEVESRPMPLVVRARIADGRWSGMRVLSKGGSAGDEEAVNVMIALAEDGQWEPNDR